MLRLKIMPDDGDSFEIVATTRDIAKWEKTTKGATFAGFQADQKITDLYKIAWFACQRQGVNYVADSLASFEAGVDLDVLDDEDAEPDPTQSAA
jgi:hypothetical protein